MTQKITLGDLEVAYKIEGPAGKPLVIMSNSLMSNMSMWDCTVPALTDRYQVLRYDTRGHGESSVPPGPYNMPQLADDLMALMNAMKIDRAHIMGLSMGGMIAQQIGARYPERVHSLLLCDTASEMPPRSLWEERFAIARKDGIAGLVESTIKRWFTAPFIERAPAEIEKVRKMILGTSVDGYINCGSAVRDMAQTTMLLKIKAPTLVMTGRLDPACTVDQSTVLHRMIDTSKMVVLEDAAHLSNIEQPAAFNARIREFLDMVSD